MRTLFLVKIARKAIQHKNYMEPIFFKIFFNWVNKSKNYVNKKYVTMKLFHYNFYPNFVIKLFLSVKNDNQKKIN